MTEIDDIKAKIDIVDFLGKYLPLKKAGRNYRAVCPFHGDKDPSLMISQDKQIWHCFGCGLGGDIFAFLMKKDGLEFSEALTQLAEQAGIQLQHKSSYGEVGLKSKLFTITELATKFFEKSLSDSKEGRLAENYLVDRGIHHDTITKFRLGYAPSGWEYLIKFLERRGYNLSDVEKAGLAVPRRGGYYDKFRNRIVFPITDVSGKVVGFTGRVLKSEDQPKYLNSPETPIFVKSRVLYGLPQAKEAIQAEKFAVLVEGQMDVLASHQASVTNVVASSGTALTSEQLQIIGRYADTVVLALDTDGAGNEATKRVIALAAKEEMEVKVALLGKYKDPDECAKNEPELWKQIVKEAVPAIDFYITQAIKKYGLDTVVGKKKVAAEVLSVIGLLENAIEREQYLKKLSLALSVSLVSLQEALSKIFDKQKIRPAAVSKSEEVVIKQDADWLEKRILGLVIFRPELYSEWQESLDKLKWPNAFLERVYEGFKNCYTDKEFLLNNLISKLEYRDQVDLSELMLVTEKFYLDMPETEISQEMTFYINMCDQRNARREMRNLSRAIATAEQAGDTEKLKELLDEFKSF